MNNELEVIYSEETKAFNFTHADGMQTSIKTEPSGHFTGDTLDRKNPILEEKNKYTVIVSSSVGCPMACNFCHLTKNMKAHKRLSSFEIVKNTLDAIEFAVKEMPELAQRYIKLCFMGEGEAILDMETTRMVSLQVLSYVMKEELACGLDGIDISTIAPKVNPDWVQQIVLLDSALANKWPLNPANYDDPTRSIVRVFYSLHHYNPVQRDIIIPNARTADYVFGGLVGHLLSANINVVVHYMFMDGVNDSEEDVEGLIDFVNTRAAFEHCEFRVLRYNGGEAPGDRESPRMKEIIPMLEERLGVRKLKIQYSSGEDIKAACGQFI